MHEDVLRGDVQADLYAEADRAVNRLHGLIAHASAMIKGGPVVSQQFQDLLEQLEDVLDGPDARDKFEALDRDVQGFGVVLLRFAVTALEDYIAEIHRVEDAS